MAATAPKSMGIPAWAWWDQRTLPGDYVRGIVILFVVTSNSNHHGTMQEASHTFLKQLVETPSPSGFERPVQDLVRNWAGAYAEHVRTDRHGNVIAVHNPEGQPRIMLAGH